MHANRLDDLTCQVSAPPREPLRGLKLALERALGLITSLLLALLWRVWVQDRHS